MTDALDVAGQLRPEVRVRDGYEGFAAFAQGFTVQVDDERAILSINNGGTLSLNLRHGKRPRELPVLLQNRRL